MHRFPRHRHRLCARPWHSSPLRHRLAGYHCWAEVYVKQIGWIPIDASEAAKNPAKRAYYFGAHDENRLEFSKDRDLMLVPKQQAAPLNYFIYSYAEIDGQPFANVASEVTYRDLAEPRL